MYFFEIKCVKAVKYIISEVQVMLDALDPKKETRQWKCEFRQYRPRCADGDISAGPAPGHWAPA